jgi:DNA-binding GntR family transcriptional regulator
MPARSPARVAPRSPRPRTSAREPGAAGRPRGRRPAPPAPLLLSSVATHQTREELAYRDIRRAIVEGRLRPGDRIVANTVAAAAGVSRIPVMQALRRLESEGFVRITPHKDVVVAGVSPEDFRERFLLMAALEGLCMRQAAGKLDPARLAELRRCQREIAAARADGDTARAVAADGRFHRMLWQLAGLRHVSQILENVWDRGEYYRMMMHERRGGFARESLGEHEQILKALESADVERAARALEYHRLRAMQRLARSK